MRAIRSIVCCIYFLFAATLLSATVGSVARLVRHHSYLDVLAVPGKMTRLMAGDAVCLALDSMKGARNSRRAILILSDGGDNDSRYTESELRKRVRESDLWVYAMGIYGFHTAVLPEEMGAGHRHLPRCG